MCPALSLARNPATEYLPKIQEIATPGFARRRFFATVLTNLEPVSASTIVVAHMLPDATEYLAALKYASRVAAVIPKPRSKDSDVLKVIEKQFPVWEVTREPATLVKEVGILIEEAPDPVVLLDIGGWFAPVLSELSRRHPQKLLGVVEDTENGHLRYEALPKKPVPIFSVARSPLKGNEDFLIGQSILFSADAILRECGSLLQYLTCSVIGYGKIGSSIAHHLLLRGIKPNVYDSEPIKRVEAYNRLCQIPSWNSLLSTSDVVFSATGKQATGIMDFRQLKNGCFVFSVTSSEDEFDFSYLEAEYKVEYLTGSVNRYSGYDNYFHLVNGGNAVNFIHRAVVGDFVQLVRAEMLCAMNALVRTKHSCGIHCVRDSLREIVVKCVAQHFC